jgi:hypothetical protein
MHTFHSKRYPHLAHLIIRKSTNFPWQRSLRLGSRADPTINIASPVTGMGPFQEFVHGGLRLQERCVSNNYNSINIAQRISYHALLLSDISEFSNEAS